MPAHRIAVIAFDDTIRVVKIFDAIEQPPVTTAARALEIGSRYPLEIREIGWVAIGASGDDDTGATMHGISRELAFKRLRVTVINDRSSYRAIGQFVIAYPLHDCTDHG